MENEDASILSLDAHHLEQPALGVWADGDNLIWVFGGAPPRGEGVLPRMENIPLRQSMAFADPRVDDNHAVHPSSQSSYLYYLTNTVARFECACHVFIKAVLVAIAIPVFTGQLESARESTDLANVRSAYAEAMAKAIEGGVDGDYTAETGPAVSSGSFDKADTSSIDWYDFSSFSVASGKKFIVKVTLSGGDATVNVEQES